MIKINLLPPDRIIKEKTPLPQFLMVIGITISVLGGSYFNGRLWLDTLSMKENINQLVESITASQDKKIQHQALEAERKSLADRQDAWQKVSTQKAYIWTEAIDAVWDTIDRNKKIWIKSLELKKIGGGGIRKPQAKGQPAADTHKLHMKCFAAGRDKNVVYSFREDLERAPKVGGKKQAERGTPAYYFELQPFTEVKEQALPLWSDGFSQVFDIELRSNGLKR